MYRRLCRRSGTKLIVSVNSGGTYLRPWIQHLHLSQAPPFNTTVGADGSPDPNGSFCFVTHRQLARALTHGTRSHVRRLLNRERAFIVVDEVHKATALRRLLASAYFGARNGKGLPRWLRPRPGPKSTRLRWLLLSATPYNPVKLDYQADTANKDIALLEDEGEREAKIIGEEVRLTLGLLAKLDRAESQRDVVNQYVESLHAALRDGGARPGVSPVAIVPKDTRHLQPRRSPSLELGLSGADIPDAISQLRRVHDGLLDLPASFSQRTTTCERLILGGARARKKKLWGHEYSKGTVRAVQQGRLRANERTIKLRALAELISRIRELDEKVVVFCVHRAVGTAVVRYLRNSLDCVASDVVDSTLSGGERLESRLAAFRRVGESPSVLVATDKLSEATDLHQACRFLVHFELPWSPLRVLQRVGRLWRIRGGSLRLPSAPHMFHVVHPGGVEEEILWRLNRRWAYLDSLGLGFMSIDVAMGERVPSVDWTQIARGSA